MFRQCPSRLLRIHWQHHCSALDQAARSAAILDSLSPARYSPNLDKFRGLLGVFKSFLFCLGNAPRGYCESIGNTTGPGGEVGDYPGQPQPGQRPLSPAQQHLLQQQQQQQQQQQRNGFPFPNRGSFPSPSAPSNNGGNNENFHPFHADKLPHSLAEANTFPSIQQVRMIEICNRLNDV